MSCYFDYVYFLAFITNVLILYVHFMCGSGFYIVRPTPTPNLCVYFCSGMHLACKKLVLDWWRYLAFFCVQASAHNRNIVVLETNVWTNKRKLIFFLV